MQEIADRMGSEEAHAEQVALFLAESETKRQAGEAARQVRIKAHDAAQ